MPKKNTLITGRAVTQAVPSPAGGVKLETFIPWTLVKRGVKKQVITPIDAPEQFREEAAKERQQKEAAKDSPLLKALGLAHYWQSLLDEGKYRSITDIAAAEGMDLGQVSRIIRLTRLAPEWIEGYLTERNEEPALEYWLRRGVPVEWDKQRGASAKGTTG